MMAEVLRKRFGFPSVLWVIGKEDRVEGEATGKFVEVVDLLCRKTEPPLVSDVGRAMSILAEFENECGSTFVNQDMTIDRYIASARWSYENALMYGGSLLMRMRAELGRRGTPVFAVGEENSFPYRMARRLVMAPYFYLCVIGHLGDRFYFEYTMYLQWNRCQEYYRKFLLEGIPDEIRRYAEQRLDELTINKLPPSDTIAFMTRGGNSLIHKLTLRTLFGVIKSNISRFSVKKNPMDPRSRSLIQDNIFHSFVRYTNKVQSKLYFKSISLKKLPSGRRYAAFFLHMQPEHTVEGLAFEFQDQAATARTIAAALPAGMLLLVKEHPTMVGLRPNRFYDELHSCSNICVLDDAISSYEVVRNSELMFTLSGSVALESMYEGKPAIVLGKIYHTNFKGIYPVDDIRRLPELVRAVLGNAAAGARREDAVTALAAMYAASYPGKFGLQYTLEEMGEAENLDSIAIALSREFPTILPQCRAL